MSKKTSSNFLIQGSILAIAGVLVRIIGIIYRIPLNNILGDEGITYYSAAYDIYSIMLLISSQSMPIAVSKLVSSKVVLKEYKNASRFLIGAIVFSAMLGLIVSTITFVFADELASFLTYPAAAPALKILAPTLMIMSILGVLRGYFQGLGSMIPTALSQILEQIANAIVSVVAAYQLFHIGEKVNEAKNATMYSYAYSAAGGTLGTCIGALTALIFMIFVFYAYQGIYKRQLARDRSRYIMGYSQVAKLLGVTILPVLLSTTIYNFSNLIDSSIFGNIMKWLGMNTVERSSTWGVYSGKYRLLTTIPIAIASSLSSSIIPSLISSYSMGDKKQVKYKIRSSVQFTMILALPCGFGLMALGVPVLNLLFANTNMEIGANLMKFSVLTVVSFSLSTITNSVLQGTDHLRIPVKNAAISLAIHLVLLPFLMVVCKLNIYGVIIADVLFAGVVCYLNQRALRKYLGYRQELKRTFILPTIASVIMAAAAWICYKLLYLVIPVNAFCTVVAIGLAAVIYFMLILLLGVVNERTLLSFPKGTILVKLAKKFHLL